MINRIENEPINVPRAMVQSLDMLSIQTLSRSGDQRVRRAKTIGEIKGIDQRTGELDYGAAFDWQPGTDTFTRNNSALIDEIADERGWSRAEQLTEIRRRERFLELLQALDISDYRTFTALVNEYYADAERVMDRLESRVETHTSAETPDSGDGDVSVDTISTAGTPGDGDSATDGSSKNEAGKNEPSKNESTEADPTEADPTKTNPTKTNPTRDELPDQAGQPPADR